MLTQYHASVLYNATQARRQGVAGGHAPPLWFWPFFLLVSSVTYGDDDNTPTPLCNNFATKIFGRKSKCVGVPPPPPR